MANQPKKYKKFVATAATATLVASAIVPVASAAHTDTAGNQFESYINQATELGLFKDGGEFKPNAKLTRKQVVTIAGRFLETAGKKPAADYETKPAFTDLGSGDAEYLRLASVVKEAGIFSGDNGKINGGDNITRQHMAKVLNGIVESVTGTSLVEAAKDIDDAKVTDLAAAGASYRDAIQALADFGITTVEKFNPKGEVTRGQFAKFIVETIGAAKKIQEGTKPTPDAAVTSVSAINKTKVEVKFSVAVDAVAKENFTIAGATVNGAELSEDKKTAVLDVTGLAYSTKYTVAVKDVKVAGKAVDFGSKEFTTPAVTSDFTLKATPAATTVTANGADNTVVKFELLGADGKVDTNADNIVLEIGTTFGNLATNRVTVQDGVGQVVLSSEFSTKEVIAKVTAQIIEASTDYKDLIGKVAGETTVKFSPSAVTTDPNAVTFQDAESNQADRVILYFDKAVSPATFVKTNADGSFQTKLVGTETAQVLKDNVSIKISQGTDEKDVVGIIPVAGNDKAVEVLLATNTTLKDNAQVDLDVKIGTTQNKRAFTLTDARKPEFTGVTATNLKTLELKFSESVAAGNFSIDGVWADPAQLTVDYGKFDAEKGIDKRDTATVKLNNVGGSTGQLYFTAGLHSITVTQLKDYAAKGPVGVDGDNANISTTQTLNFSVVADTAAPTATVKVESPEQIRVTFNKDVDALVGGSGQAATVEALFNDAFKVYDEASKTWVNLNSSNVSTKFKDPATPAAAVTGTTLANILSVVEVGDNEFVAELKADWTQILQGSTDTYHNYKFKLEFDKEEFQSVTNGVKNAKFELDLSATDSPLTKADNVSPVISAIEATKNSSEYEIVMNEPVKLTGKDNADTVSTLQTSGIPTVTAEFQGKDKDGKAVVIPAQVKNYSDKDGGDKKFIIATSADTLQSLVNAGYNENWTVVVRSISDDIGNTASTLTKDFVVKTQTVSTGFQIVSDENGLANKVFAFDETAVGKQDRLEVTFTKGVNVAGGDNLTSVYNWTLNGTKLSNLSNVASIKVEDVDGNDKNGYEKVIITFADERAFGKTSNVVSVTKGIKSLDGTVLSGEYEVVAKTITTVATTKVVTTATELQNALNDSNVTNIEVTKNIQLTAPANVINPNQVINLNGYKVTADATNGHAFVVAAANTTIKNGSIEAPNNGVYVQAGNATVEGINFTKGGVNVVVTHLATTSVTKSTFSDMSIAFVLVANASPGPIDFTTTAANVQKFINSASGNKFTLKARTGKFASTNGIKVLGVTGTTGAFIDGADAVVNTTDTSF